GAAHDDDADGRIVLEILHDLRDRLPHFERDGVVARRIVEDQAADRTVLLGEHFRGERLVEHWMAPVRLVGWAEQREAHQCGGKCWASLRSAHPTIACVLQTTSRARRSAIA